MYHDVVRVTKQHSVKCETNRKNFVHCYSNKTASLYGLTLKLGVLARVTKDKSPNEVAQKISLDHYGDFNNTLDWYIVYRKCRLLRGYYDDNSGCSTFFSQVTENYHY